MALQCFSIYTLLEIKLVYNYLAFSIIIRADFKEIIRGLYIIKTDSYRKSCKFKIVIKN